MIDESKKADVDSRVNLLSQRLGRPVTDKTGLTGLYDFALSWTPDPTDFGPDGLPVGAGPADRDKGVSAGAIAA